jgi:BirA family transcriptional regulator, biotin operon repressor / biotin---[acetyl-CoA-carboxylase] ligase
MINTLFVGKVCHHLDVLPSTNTFARDLIAKGNPIEGTAVLTANQTAGRGQFGREWHTAPHEALTVSFILFPTALPPDRLFELSLAMALAVRAAVAAFVPSERVTVKWPNDVYIDDQKVAGILIENALSVEGFVSSSVVGVGINLHQTSFPADLHRATSIHLAAGTAPQWHAIYDALCAEIESAYLTLQSDQHQGICAAYQKVMYALGSTRDFERINDGSRFSATVAGIGAQGDLLLRVHDGGVLACAHGQLRWL